MIFRPIYYHHNWKQNSTHHQRSSSYFQNWVFARSPWRAYLPLSACVPNQTRGPHSRPGTTVPGARCWDGGSGLHSWKAGGLCASYPGRDHHSGRSLGVVLCWHCGPRFGWLSYGPFKELLQLGPSDARSQGEVRARVPKTGPASHWYKGLWKGDVLSRARQRSHGREGNGHLSLRLAWRVIYFFLQSPEESEAKSLVHYQM